MFSIEENDRKIIMKKKLAILGSNHSLKSLNSDDLSENYSLVVTEIEMSLISLMNHPIAYERQELMSGDDKKIVSCLLSEYEKDGLNNLIASNPDILILDFFIDVLFGVSETLSGSYVTNNDDYVKNVSFTSIPTVADYCPLGNLDFYATIWTQALKKFMAFINIYLPKTKVMIYENMDVIRQNLAEYNIDTINDPSEIILQKFNQQASATYDLPLISDLLEIDLSLGNAVENNVYDFNMVRNEKFDNEGEFWTSLESIPFDDENTRFDNGELTLYGNRDEMATFNFLSAAINIAASPENPVDVVLSYEVFAEDIFDLATYHDHVFIGRGFKNNLEVSSSDAIQKIYDQQAKLLNLTSGKWKKIKKIITVTVPYLRVGPYVRGKTTVKWRNISLKHHRSDEK